MDLQHKHNYADTRYSGTVLIWGWMPWPWSPFNVAEDQDTYTPDSTGSTGGGEAHNTIQPSAVVKYIIKY